MPGELASAAQTCTNCDASLAGDFCGRCGAPKEEKGLGLLGVAVNDILGAGAGEGSFTTLLALLRRPIHNTLARVEDPLYRSHGSFLLATTAIYLMAAGFVISQQLSLVQRLAGRRGFEVAGHEGFGRIVALLRDVFFPIMIYLALASIAVLGYYVFARLSKRAADPRRYLKLTCLASGLTLVALTVVNAAFYVAMGRIGERMLASADPAAGLLAFDRVDAIVHGLVAAIALGIAIYIFAVNRRFWRIGYLRMTGGLLAVAAGATIVTGLASTGAVAAALAATRLLGI